MNRRAFTLIEILVVVGIILVLAGLILAGGRLLRETAKRGRTESILGMALQGIHTWAAEQGGLPSPAEHPLAGSRDPRSVFVRNLSGSCATTGLALAGVDQNNLMPADRDRLLLPDDRFADPAVPGLYGLRRDRLGVLGAGLGESTRFKMLPMQAMMASIIANPDDATVGRNIQPPDGPAANVRLIQTVYGKGGALEDLVRIRAMWTPPDDLPAHLSWHDRVWSATKAGVVVDGQAGITEGGTVQHYRLRGPALYDAWGNEILVSVTEDGRNIRLMSAGRNGSFVWLPGSDGILQTDARSDVPAGDDHEASSDNVTLGER